MDQPSKALKLYSGQTTTNLLTAMTFHWVLSRSFRVSQLVRLSSWDPTNLTLITASSWTRMHGTCRSTHAIGKHRDWYQCRTKPQVSTLTYLALNQLFNFTRADTSTCPLRSTAQNVGPVRVSVSSQADTSMPSMSPIGGTWPS